MTQPQARFPRDKAARPRARALPAPCWRSRSYPRLMTPEEFRAAGRAAIDWIADYLEGVERFPVASPVVPGTVRAALPAKPPTDTEPFAALLRDLDDVVLPGLTHWQHPKFFAYFPSNTSYASIL